MRYLLPILQDESEYVRRAGVEVLNEIADTSLISELLLGAARRGLVGARARGRRARAHRRPARGRRHARADQERRRVRAAHGDRGHQRLARPARLRLPDRRPGRRGLVGQGARGRRPRGARHRQRRAQPGTRARGGSARTAHRAARAGGAR
ncbi:MAG: hypothetical protein U5K43_01710 [Halofilum sp. (in: g-proteobacteria)]|nr:hypothetical protein [Halofilum sp. (in: g-proteobacteria)]